MRVIQVLEELQSNQHHFHRKIADGGMFYEHFRSTELRIPGKFNWKKKSYTLSKCATHSKIWPLRGEGQRSHIYRVHEIRNFIPWKMGFCFWGLKFSTSAVHCLFGIKENFVLNTENMWIICAIGMRCLNGALVLSHILTYSHWNTSNACIEYFLVIIREWHVRFLSGPCSRRQFIHIWYRWWQYGHNYESVACSINEKRVRHKWITIKMQHVYQLALDWCTKSKRFSFSLALSSFPIDLGHFDREAQEFCWKKAYCDLLKQLFHLIQHLIGNYYILTAWSRRWFAAILFYSRRLRFCFVLCSLLCVNRCNKTEIKYDFHGASESEKKNGNESISIAATWKYFRFFIGSGTSCDTLPRWKCTGRKWYVHWSMFPCSKAINNMILLQDIPFTQVNFH